MIKRPLDPRFSAAVRDGRKFTTIREKAWPVGVPIMLYNWSGKPYRSKHVNVAVVKVSGFWRMEIAHLEGGEMRYACGMENAKPLHEREGFESGEAMDDWFRPLVKEGETMEKVLMRFEVIELAS